MEIKERDMQDSTEVEEQATKGLESGPISQAEIEALKKKDKFGYFDFEIEQFEKQMMRNFSEVEDQATMVCKRLRKDYKALNDHYENN